MKVHRCNTCRRSCRRKDSIKKKASDVIRDNLKYGIVIFEDRQNLINELDRHVFYRIKNPEAVLIRSEALLKKAGVDTNSYYWRAIINKASRDAEKVLFGGRK